MLIFNEIIISPLKRLFQMAINKQQVRSALTHVIHPEGEKDIISLNMVEDLSVQDRFTTFTIYLPEKNAALEAKFKDLSEESIRKLVDRNAVLDINTAVNISKFRTNEDKRAFRGQGYRNQTD